MNIYETFIAGLLVVTFLSVAMTVASKQRMEKRRLEKRTQNETLRRYSDHVDVITEFDDGYGIALRQMEDGVLLSKFDEADEIYQEVRVEASQLEAVANELSWRAVENSDMMDARYTANPTEGEC